MNALPRPALCLVTDRRAVDPAARTAAAEAAALELQLEEAIETGVDLIQIRESDLEARLLLGLVMRTVNRASKGATRIVVNDRADIAAAAGCGVHLKSDGPPPSLVRPLVAAGRLIGCSVHEPLTAGSAHGADYVVFGTVFPSASKPAGSATAGLEGLRRASAAFQAPVLAIGGITMERATECRDAGAAGIAAIGLFLPPGRTPASLGPRRAVAALRDAWTIK